MQSVEEIVAFLEQALQSGVRSRLVDRGEARAIIRRNGEVPDGAPPLGRDLDADLADFGFAVLDASLALRSLDRNHGTLRPAFQLAGRVFEALVKNGSTDVAERGFYRTIAGASYHLAGYAAMAYALFNSIEREELNLNPAEDLLVLLILRNFDVLRETSRAWLQDPSHSDEALSDQVRSDETSREYSLGLAVISGVYRGFSYFELALQTGDVGLVEKARSYLDGALGLASASGLVSLWWITRLARNLIDDLWAMSLHELIPLLPRSGSSEAYTNYRRIFIARLFQQKAAQVDLWPSQINAARRAA
ncbi:MAG: DEAD/DEAH box helicase, partial [Cyanobacteria bacterium J06648_11]